MKAREERGSEGRCENYMKLKLQGPHVKGFVCLPEMASHDLGQVSFYLSLQTVPGQVESYWTRADHWEARGQEFGVSLGNLIRPTNNKQTNTSSTHRGPGSCARMLPLPPICVLAVLLAT